MLVKGALITCYGFLWFVPLRWRHNGHDCVSNHRGPVNSPHKGPVTRKMFPFDDVIMSSFFRMTMSTSSSNAGKKRICFSLLVLMTMIIITFPEIFRTDKYHTHDSVNIISNISLMSPENKCPDSRLHKFENLEKIMEEIAQKIENMRPTYVPGLSTFDTKAPFLPEQTFREFTPVSDDTYFDKIRAVTNADLVAIYANQSKLLAAVNDKYFLHCSNDIERLHKHEATAFLNRSCDHQAWSFLPNVGFHPGVLSVSMPGEKTWKSQDGYLLTYLHIFRDAAVAPNGDIYLYHVVNTKLVPWRCPRKDEKFPTSRLQSRRVYDEVKFSMNYRQPSIKSVTKSSQQHVSRLCPIHSS